MAFKADASFLEFVTMGAVGARTVARYLARLGFEPIELERCATTNKLWAEKIKRLRLADLLCTRTGIRFEVRAKSNLELRMSHAPKNPDRAWDAGLRDSDVVAFLRLESAGTTYRAVGDPVFFDVAALRASAPAAVEGDRKSAGEGAELSITWPAWCPEGTGRVTAVTKEKITVEYEGKRTYSYSLKGKTPYCTVGTIFSNASSVLAGVVASRTDLRAKLASTWNPIALLEATDARDRYAAARAVARSSRSDEGDGGRAALRSRLPREQDTRVAIEIAGGLLQLDDGSGADFLSRAIDAGETDLAFKMEIALLLAEIRNPVARSLLMDLARGRGGGASDLRQAAVWGLGFTGHEDRATLLRYVADGDDAVALHAICAMGHVLDADSSNSVIRLLASGSPRERGAALAILRRASGEREVSALRALAARPDGGWARAALAILDRVELPGVPPAAQEQIEELRSLTASGNWLVGYPFTPRLYFLERQSVGGPLAEIT